ncbi:hypothetical protein [Shouchella clausii]|uniref:hypothetical protein n=1 Tax=Shouchella clausii TaxID=79880 RepID=UPI000B9711E2|nr:hypothetical protein [Shouchella clausii]AST97734.1 hypothetical protein BC8716_17940 [Shouchella clausii]MBU8595078.1 hypothetical protein [Shouchella clausii]MCR1288594.1 hypothetical protein [Shouchella clausii]MEB5475022.1 hypothetical protein [Shouchella clausii]MED4157965.1 hypothetical protein [Shouchella clausii]
MTDAKIIAKLLTRNIFLGRIGMFVYKRMYGEAGIGFRTYRWIFIHSIVFIFVFCLLGTWTFAVAVFHRFFKNEHKNKTAMPVFK